LYITNGYPPLRWAGTETYTAGIAEEFAHRGHEVGVLCAGEFDRGEAYWNGVTEDVYHGVRVHRLHLNWGKSPDPFGYLHDNPLVAEYLNEFLQRFRPDLVHVTSCETLSASVLAVVKEAGIPLVLTLTDFWFLCPRTNLLQADESICSGQTTPGDCLDCMMQRNQSYRRIRKVIPPEILKPVTGLISQAPSLTRLRGLRGLAGDMAERKSMLQHALTLPDVRITASPFVRDMFLSNGVTAPILVKPYGHDLSWLATYHGKTSSTVVRLGFIGQIINAKGLHLILGALSRLPEPVLTKFTLSIYGKTDSFPNYARKVRELAAGFPNVSFEGTYPHAESGNIFSNLDVLLVPSIWYDFPLVIHEAFASGTPVIATNLGGMAEAVEHERNGLLFERGNVDDLAHQLERVVTEPDLLSKLQLGFPPVRTNADEVDDLLQLFKKLAASPLVLGLMNLVALSACSTFLGGW
jgi:glycosyltransferase involved in cell wall biosynthesis